MSLMRLAASAALKEKRLAALRADAGAAGDAAAHQAVQDAQLLGSLELAGCDFSWNDVQAVRAGSGASDTIVRLRDALDLAQGDAPFSVGLLRGWHEVLAGPVGLRRGERPRAGGPPAAPPALIESRLINLESWLNTDASGELQPARAGALVLARLVEILPFDDGNGRVARLAATHVMRRAGSRPPILCGADRQRLEAALQAAFQLDTEPLAELLEEAAERSLDVMLQVLGSPGPLEA